jgi:predicted acylesterase/phospholipase RssA
MPLIFSFRDIAAWLDDRSRLADLVLERIETNPAPWFAGRRENFEAFLWPSLIAAAFWTGMPTLNKMQLLGVLVGVVAWMALRALNGVCLTATEDLFFQVALLFELGAFIWMIGPNEAGTGSLVYKHVFIPIVLIIGVSLLLSAFFATQLLRPLQQQSKYGEYLNRTELFQSRGKRIELASNRWMKLLAYVFAVLLRPMELLLPVAFVILVAPPAWLRGLAITATLMMVLILLMCASDERLDHSVRLITRRFSRNAALLVSAAAMALAVARLFQNTYVTTVFDSASGLEIVLYFLAAYAVAWWYDYWTERLLGQQLFLIIDPAAHGTSATAYVYAGCTYTSVPRDSRTVELHGLGRMLVFRPNSGNWPYFQPWSYTDFFAHLAASGAPGGKAMPQPNQVNQRIILYLGSTALLTVGLLCAGGWALHESPKNFELQVQTRHGTGLHLGALLDQKNSVADSPVILVAASGGGTRAAVFAGAVLEGLSETQHEAIRVGSGVSGGSAALAYYAAKRNDLTGGEVPAWNVFFDRLSQPFIRDVIERAQEWRMAEHGRVGILLAESFERRWGLEQGKDTFAQLSGFGLICNSTLAGRFDRGFLTPKEQNDSLSVEQVDARYPHVTRSDVAGGRLVMTNLDLHDVFSDPQPPFIPGIPLPIVVDDRDTRVQRAAALSANFPPVFSNAAIDVNDQARYWVTDGGAADNRGLEPLLFALRHTVKTRLAQKAELPNIAVVIIEASGIDESFDQNRGLGSSLGAGAHFADQLDKQLYEDLMATYRSAEKDGKLRFYYIPMPSILRMSGSFGTHWMLQDYIDVKRGDISKTFKGTQVVRALRAAYGCRDAGDSSQLVDWIRTSPEFSNWCSMRNSIQRGNGGGQACGCASSHPGSEAQP